MVDRARTGPTAADRGREVRERLLQAAVELIPRHGWGAVSTRMVAEQAGVTPGLVHYHFASLQALLSDAALGTIRELIGGIPALLDDARSPRQALNILFATLDSYQGRDPVSLLMAETYMAATRNEPLREALAAVIADFRSELAGALERLGVRDAAGCAAVLSAALDGVVLHRALGLALPAATVTRVLGRTLEGDKG
jgi:AcrR family transcriptional regulator